MRRSLCLTSAAVLAATLVWTAAAPALAQSDTSKVNDNGLTCFNGYAYTLKGGDYRYTEHHEVKRVHGRITTWNVTYVGRHGQVIANKHMDFSDNSTIPVYRLTMPKSGYEEGIRHDRTAAGRCSNANRPTRRRRPNHSPSTTRWPPIPGSISWFSSISTH